MFKWGITVFSFCVLSFVQVFASPLDALPKNLDRSDSLAGPDLNANGIRDDIDSWIAKLGYASPQQKAVEQLARSHQKAVTVTPSDTNTVREVADLNSKAINCVFAKFNAPDLTYPGVISQKIESITTNTKPRLMNYLAYNKALDGTVSSLPDGDTCE